ncbi:MAG: YceI family protein [Nitrospiraceae bacterium]|nr:YceI family protein [Nitrospiraceae bacterium]
MAKWNIDPDHSVAAFSSRHMKIANVRGQFNGITGTIDFDPANPAGASVRAEIAIASLTTGIKQRDAHLLSADFLEAAAYPSMSFVSTKIEPLAGGRAKVTGDLTLRGTTRSVTFDAGFFGPVKSPEALGGETTVGFSASTMINRFDFGVKWDVKMDDGSLIVDREVKISIDVEADLEE